MLALATPLPASVIVAWTLIVALRAYHFVSATMAMLGAVPSK